MWIKMWISFLKYIWLVNNTAVDLWNKTKVMAHTLSILPYFIAAVVVIYKFNRLTKLK
jgi:hypothetical protein